MIIVSLFFRFMRNIVVIILLDFINYAKFIKSTYLVRCIFERMITKVSLFMKKN